MVSRRQFLALAGATGATVVGVALGVRALPDDKPDGSSGPPTIRLGSDTCDHCNMIISDIRFASAWRHGTTAARFDDIACMVRASREHEPGSTTTFYVHDFNDESWLIASAATFIVTPAIVTPMASGIAAFGSAAAAHAVATEHDTVLQSWAGVRESLPAMRS